MVPGSAPSGRRSEPAPTERNSPPPVKGHEKDGGERRALHGHPHYAEIVGYDNQKHREPEQRSQRVILAKLHVEGLHVSRFPKGVIFSVPPEVSNRIRSRDKVNE